MLQNNLTTS